MSKTAQGYQQGVEAERKRCVGVAEAVAAEMNEILESCDPDARGTALGMLMVANTILGRIRKGDDNGNG